MIKMFIISNSEWNLALAEPHSDMLKRSDGSYTLGVTDNNLKTIFISNQLNDYMLERVLCHEITHAMCFERSIEIPIEIEEKLCNFMSDYGREIIEILDEILEYFFKKVA